MSAEGEYPTVTVLLQRVERLRRSVSHLRELNHQGDILLGDLADQVDDLPEVGETDEGAEGEQ